MLVNHGFSQQSSNEEHKPWKWGATAKYYTSHVQRSCHQRGSPCQDARGNQTPQRPPHHRKETLAEVVLTCFPSLRSGRNHLARHSERGKKTRQTEEELGRQHQGMDRPGVRQVSEGSGEQGKMEKTGCKIICGAPTTLEVKGLMMMMMMMMLKNYNLCGLSAFCSANHNQCGLLSALYSANHKQCGVLQGLALSATDHN